jgi:hypothetical protein
MKKPVLIGIVLALLVVGYIVYSSMNLASHRVEVCITFNGRTNCRTASGASEEYARRTATTNACADIASGVTDSIACENTPPNSVKVIK